eukprot:TRINITY_DN4897_c0_g1_i11.p1 TRINITY_DN4897_c0_g1~~TRINITY_DN4897_c0_g1_i11.p1  ORF type:complete len:475 (+),score=74.98 TRINITY_DN4897_c0_g1_i11:167-1591(+)
MTAPRWSRTLFGSLGIDLGCFSLRASSRARCTRMQLAVVSCNKISVVETLDPQEDLWTDLCVRAGRHEIDLVVHLGDQVYADDSMHDIEGGKVQLTEVEHCKFLQAKRRLKDVESENWLDYTEEVCDMYRDVYRKTWSHPPTRRALANVPNVMIMDDHEIRDDWGDDPDDHMTDSMEHFIARCGYRVFCEYQGQLYSHVPGLQHPVSDEFLATKQHRIFRIARIGFVLVDMRCARTFNFRPGVDASNSMLGQDQWADIDEALSPGGLVADCDTLIFGSGVPLLFYTTKLNDFLGSNCKDSDDLLGHWSNSRHKKEQARVLRLLRGWKKKDRSRNQILLIGGDVHVGGFTTLYDYEEDKTLANPLALQLFSSSIGNSQFNAFTQLGIRMMGGDLNPFVDGHECVHHTFHFKHHHWTPQRNYGLVWILNNLHSPTGDRLRCQLILSDPEAKKIVPGLQLSINDELPPAVSCGCAVL